MQLTILGGGGFRVPLVYSALLNDPESMVTSVVLYDVSAARLAAITQVLRQMRSENPQAPSVRTTTDLEEALPGADFVFSAIRVGGLEGRIADEQVALQLGLLGQETTGPGGIAFGLRTVPVALQIAEAVATHCPDAWVINFTNPAGMITEAMQQVLGDRVIGICDSPVSLVRHAMHALNLDPREVVPQYVGLNHLGWLVGLSIHGRNALPELFDNDAALAAIEEVQLFGTECVRDLCALPNEYVYYYYFTDQAVAAIQGSPRTRGEFLLSQQSAFYNAVAQRPKSALENWHRARRERNATYMEESRDSERSTEDATGGGYEQVALDLMRALSRDEQTMLILNVRNGQTLETLPPGAVIEVTCTVDAAGARAQDPGALQTSMLELMKQVKAAEQLAIAAAMTGSYETAREAFARHPLVNSEATAGLLLDEYRARIPEVAATIRP